nr:uncharacterized protein LOC107279982 [Oryza sativa Japonica Group]
MHNNTPVSSGVGSAMEGDAVLDCDVFSYTDADDANAHFSSSVFASSASDSAMYSYSDEEQLLTTGDGSPSESLSSTAKSSSSPSSSSRRLQRPSLRMQPRGRRASLRERPPRLPARARLRRVLARATAPPCRVLAARRRRRLSRAPPPPLATGTVKGIGDFAH